MYYYSILHGIINTCRGKAELKNFQIILYHGCSSTIIIHNMMSKLNLKKYISTQWQTKYEKLTTDNNIKVYL